MTPEDIHELRKLFREAIRDDGPATVGAFIDTYIGVSLALRLSKAAKHRYTIETVRDIVVTFPDAHYQIIKQLERMMKKYSPMPVTRTLAEADCGIAGIPKLADEAQAHSN